MTVFLKDNKTMQAALFTSSVAYKGIAIACKRKSLMFFPFWEKTTMWMTLSNPSKKKPTKTTNSIATGHTTLDVGEFVGWDELEDRPFDPLFV